MMKYALLLITLGICILSSCTKPTPSPTTTTSASTTTAKATDAMPAMSMDSELVVQLKKEALIRHLHFIIICNDDPDDQPFFGGAWEDKGANTFNSMYIEEGGVPEWTARGITQDAVAKTLYRNIREREPDYFPKHKRSSGQKRQCPEPIRG